MAKSHLHICIVRLKLAMESSTTFDFLNKRIWNVRMLVWLAIQPIQLCVPVYILFQALYMYQCCALGLIHCSLFDTPERISYNYVVHVKRWIIKQLSEYGQAVGGLHTWH